MNPGPEFDTQRCYGCWGCFNRCPKRAIYTRKLRGKGHYPKPADELKKKLTTLDPFIGSEEAGK
jgi:Fe-S-cluster-containing hydrogenase component 2